MVAQRCWLGQGPSEDLLGQISIMVSRLAGLLKLLAAQQELLMEARPCGLSTWLTLLPAWWQGPKRELSTMHVLRTPDRTPKSTSATSYGSSKAQIPGEQAERPPGAGRGKVTLQKNRGDEGHGQSHLCKRQSASPPHRPNTSAAKVTRSFWDQRGQIE